MTSQICLSDQELLLHYYEDPEATTTGGAHLANCPDCTERLNALRREMTALPDLQRQHDPHADTRMAAMVTEKLNRRRRSWLPAIGTAAIASLALILSITVWTPQPESQQTTRLATASMPDNIDDEMSDIDFLEDLELLKELELLSQIEGV